MLTCSCVIFRADTYLKYSEGTIIKISSPSAHDLYKWGVKFLKKNKVECYCSDAKILFESCFNLSYSQLITDKNHALSSKQIAVFDNMLKRRANGEPVQYVTGGCEFMNIKLNVGPGVLIPRDDTEVLVRKVLKIINKKNEYLDKGKLKILELGAGTGAIAIAIKKFAPAFCEVVALELSELAFGYLKSNTKMTGVQIQCVQGNILTDFVNFDDLEFDIIVSNPPYIPSKDINFLDKEVKCEPLLALDGGYDGLKFYRIICDKWSNKIKKGGFLAVEIGINQQKDVTNLLHIANFKNLEFESDINSIPRVIVGQKGV